MLAYRTAAPALRAARSSFTRGYSTAPAPKSGSSSLPLYFGIAGVAGLGAFAYLQRNPPAVATVAAEAAAASVPETAATTVALIKDTWVPVTLSKIDQYNHNSKVYKFDFEGEDGKDKISGISVAGALVVRSIEGEGELKDDKGKPVIRAYTPLSSPDQKGSIDLLIKEYPDGKLSGYIAKLKEGEKVLFKGPILKYAYEPNKLSQALFVSGGSGITPAYQLITHALDIPEDKTKFTLLFANVTEKDILLRKEWDTLAAQHPDRLKVVYFLDKAPWGWKGETGFITADKIKKHFPRQEGDVVKAFVCGPPGQVKAIAGPKDGPRQGPLAPDSAFAAVFKEDEVFKF